ncbi:MAG TPA: efflux RND transporter periplasmic adaptor subunit, partial [Burkholderiales bacterium]|nr:efflux RND transporter periplasmic adaptor subunit [Burkholderiales bacterium]
LAPTSGGLIYRLKVKESERVKKGQVLIELWNKDLLAQKQIAMEQLASSRDHMNEVCPLAGSAESDLKRKMKLWKRGFISAEGLENARAEAGSKRASCDAAKADIKAAKARIDLAEAGIEKSTIVAPFDGVVAKVSGELGEFTTPSPPGIPTPPAIDLIDDSCLYVTAPIDEVDAPSIRLGMPTRITLDAFPGKHFAGRVSRIAPYVLDIEKQARTVDIDVDFVDKQDEKPLLAGYSADAEVILASHENTLRIPTRALLEKNRVLVLKEGRLEERKVKTGLSNWEYTEVLGGLEAGDEVVVSLEKSGVKAGAMAVREK